MGSYRVHLAREAESDAVEMEDCQFAEEAAEKYGQFLLDADPDYANLLSDGVNVLVLEGNGPVHRLHLLVEWDPSFIVTGWEE